MIQTRTAADSAPHTGRVPALTVVTVTDNKKTRELLAAAIQTLGRSVALVNVDEPADVADIQPETPIAAYCLSCDSDRDTASRALGLIKGVSTLAPILLIDGGDAGLTVGDALAEGAWDLVSPDDAPLLALRLNQAVDIGRVRHELLEAGQRLNQSQRRLDVLLSQGQDARATLHGSRIVDPNAAFARLIGATDANKARGLDLLERVVPHDRSRVAEALDQVVRSNNDTTLSFELLARHGQPQSVRAVFTPGVNSDGAEHCIHVVAQLGDRDRLSLPETSRQSALDGRMALHSILRQVSGRAKERVLGLMFIAIDDIPALQSSLGLAESDLLLQEAGLFLLQAMRGEDRIFRFGNGEYVMLVERHSSNELGEFSRQLQAALAEEVFGDGQRSASLSATLTYCLLGGANESDRRLQALMNTTYELRQAGGNTCQEYTPDPGSDSADSPQQGQGEWVERLRQALSHDDRFSLAYQGITSLAGDSQPYFDVLLRYVDDNGALVRPGEFLPAAEKANLMPAIDRWVTRRAVDVIFQQQAKDVHIALFVKLSATTIAAGDEFVTWLKEALAARTIPRQNIIFSIREDDARGQIVQARRLATALEGLGFRMALSHYGSTPKAVQVLDKMPASFIKLSSDFAHQMLGANEDERLAHIITSARERQLPLIAEQIEDANSMARLWQAGVNYVQGHFIQEPNTEALAHTHDLQP